MDLFQGSSSERKRIPHQSSPSSEVIVISSDSEPESITMSKWAAGPFKSNDLDDDEPIFLEYRPGPSSSLKRALTPDSSFSETPPNLGTQPLVQSRIDPFLAHRSGESAKHEPPAASSNEMVDHSAAWATFADTLNKKPAASSNVKYEQTAASSNANAKLEPNPSLSDAKLEPTASWGRFMTISVYLHRTVFGDQNRTQGKRLSYEVDDSFLRVLDDYGEAIGSFYSNHSLWLIDAIKTDKLRLAIFDLGLVLDHNILVCIDLMCRFQDHVNFSNRLATSFTEFRRRYKRTLPPSAQVVAQQVRGNLLKVDCRTNADQNRFIRPPDPGGNPAAMLVSDAAFSFVPNDDEEDDDENGQNVPISADQLDVMGNLATGNYQGRNALSTLYDEQATIDVATLAIYPFFDHVKRNGLLADLYHHQSQGLAWMIRAEHPQLPCCIKDGAVKMWIAKRLRGGGSRYYHLAKLGRGQKTPPKLPRGGILSDDMGLGKTLQIIALCLSDPTAQKLLALDRQVQKHDERKRLKTQKNKGKGKQSSQDSQDTMTDPDDDDQDDDIIDPLNKKYIKTTLIVCPLSVIYNWVSQLEQHTDPSKVKFAVLHGPTLKSLKAQAWSTYDFIITTYDVLKSEFRPIDQARTARQAAEDRANKIELIEAALRSLENSWNVEARRTELENSLKQIQEEHEQKMQAWINRHSRSSKQPLKQAFQVAQRKQTQSKGKHKMVLDFDSNFDWSSSDSSVTQSTSRRKASSTKHGTSKSGSHNSSNKRGDVKYNFDELFAYEVPIIFKTKFRRVVLDEAHVGRNSKTLAHKAILELSTERMWCVTGTPLINTTKDLQSLCAFLRIEHLQDLVWWKKVIEKAIRDGDHRGTNLLRRIIFCTTLRRTKDMQGLDGRSLIQLPPINLYKHSVELDPETRTYYDRVATIMRDQVVGLYNSGELMSQYANVLIFLCRLRQICCSRQLVPSDYLIELERAVVEMAQNDTPPNTEFQLGDDQVKALQEKLRAFITTGAEECPICMDALKDARITTCSHVFCFECIQAVIQTQAKCPLDRRPLPQGSQLISLPAEELFVQPKDEEEAEDIKNVDALADALNPPDSPALTEDPPPAKEEADIRSPTFTEDDPPTPNVEAGIQSAKIDQLVAILKTTEQTSSPFEVGVKSLVFSNFVSFLDLVAVRLRTEGIPFCRFDGSMNKKKRDKVLRSFERPIPPRGNSLIRTESHRNRVSVIDLLERETAQSSTSGSAIPSAASFSFSRAVKGKRRATQMEQAEEEGFGTVIPRVLLISIQAGALGLNLMAASQVFILDPWWQGQIEAQAIDRVHRIGQKRSVKVFQFVCKDTVEDRVMEIQQQKEQLIQDSFAGIQNRGVAIKSAKERKESTLQDILRIFNISAGENRNEESSVQAASSSSSFTQANQVVPQVAQSRVVVAETENDPIRPSSETTVRESRSSTSSTSSSEPVVTTKGKQQLL